jgi:hypothetical protein
MPGAAFRTVTGSVGVAGTSGVATDEGASPTSGVVVGITGVTFVDDNAVGVESSLSFFLDGREAFQVESGSSMTG